MGLIRSFGWTETLRRETESFQSHLGETEIPIGETEVTRVCGNGYVNRTRWRRIECFGRAKFDFWFGTYVDMRKLLRDFGAYH